MMASLSLGTYNCGDAGSHCQVHVQKVCIDELSRMGTFDMVNWALDRNVGLFCGIFVWKDGTKVDSNGMMR